MNFISWNVNGIRAVHKKGNFKWIIDQDADFFCLQEVKAERDQLIDEIQNIKGYYSYFDHSKGRKGYSGVAIYTKHEPLKIELGMNIPELDQEGRMIGLYYKDFVLFNVYFPNGGGGPVRLDFKLKFYDAFLNHIQSIRKTGKKIVFCGDINTAHEAIDLARPKENEENTGFLPEERAWLDEVVNAGYVDVYRHFYPTKTGAYTYWDQKSAARERNVGWRIDYFFVSQELLKDVKSIKIHSEIRGSDHCPLEMELKK
ncbi:MAG: exodeoxyribonuclease III [Patescibacteria group bacterium]